MAGLMDDGHTCEACGDEVSFEFIPVEPHKVISAMHHALKEAESYMVEHDDDADPHDMSGHDPENCCLCEVREAIKMGECEQ